MQTRRPAELGIAPTELALANIKRQDVADKTMDRVWIVANKTSRSCLLK
jgi:hypothetical protein